MEIGVWGDSITYGACDAAGLGWVGRVRVQFNDGNIEVYNRGVSGDTTKDLLKRFSIEAASIQPQKIIFAIGINDSKYRGNATTNEVPLEDFMSNMRELVSAAKKYTADISIVGPTRVLEEAIPGTSSRFVNKDIAVYEDTLLKIASSEGISFISVADVLDVTTDLDDGLHPNARGYEKLAAHIGAILGAKH